MASASIPSWPRPLGVSAAIVHNFAWHVRWTWRDRMRPGTSRIRAFIRFVGANGVVSLIGSVLLMPVLLAAGLPAITGESRDDRDLRSAQLRAGARGIQITTCHT